MSIFCRVNYLLYFLPFGRNYQCKPLTYIYIYIHIYIYISFFFIISDDDAILVYERTLSTARKTAISGNDLLGTLLNCLTSSSIFPLGNSDKDSKEIQEKEILKDGRSRFITFLLIFF